MKQTPINDFAIVKDVERKFVVHAGNYGECIDYATNLNIAYQSTAYRVELWETR